MQCLPVFIFACPIPVYHNWRLRVSSRLSHHASVSLPLVSMVLDGLVCMFCFCVCLSDVLVRDCSVSERNWLLVLSESNFLLCNYLHEQRVSVPIMEGQHDSLRANANVCSQSEGPEPLLIRRYMGSVLT